MAGSSVVHTRTKIGDLVEHKWVWTPDTTTSAVTAGTTGNSSGQIVGKPVRFTTIPSATKPPTDNYDVYLMDPNGVDILNALGADRDTANIEHKIDTDGLLFVFATNLTISVTAAGTTGGGTALLYVLDFSSDPL